MDGFSYTNIFATKGIEYLAIIGFFLLMIPFWMLLTRKSKSASQMQLAGRLITAATLRIPHGIFFSKFHSWAYLEKSGVARVGLDDLLLHLTGEVNITHLKEPGDRIHKGELLTQINQDGKSLRIFSPISGEIQQTNEMLADEPGLMKEDPYRQGWMYAIKPSNWKADTNTHFLAEDASNWAAQELNRFKDFLSVSVTKHLADPTQVVLQDGGELVDQPLAELPPEVWQDFQETFLS
ncbi:glycine cleavage system protein H [Sunxiuqinia sp. sy24]|uniref:glycine cleavage system protein H n=1 Tax=Sunxiuqinia sp. sy24 TaxID=3461495 RepID=UPI004045571C